MRNSLKIPPLFPHLFLLQESHPPLSTQTLSPWLLRLATVAKERRLLLFSGLNWLFCFCKPQTNTSQCDTTTRTNWPQTNNCVSFLLLGVVWEGIQAFICVLLLSCHNKITVAYLAGVGSNPNTNCNNKEVFCLKCSSFYL